MKFQNKRGFTLIEIMIVVVCVGILAAIGIPTYQNAVQKGRLTTAKEVLSEAAQSLERSFSLNNAYPSSIPSALTTAPKAGEGTAYFNITYTPSSDYSSYTLVAKVVSTYNPDSCQKLELDSTGAKLASDTSGGSMSSTTGAKCWNNS